MKRINTQFLITRSLLLFCIYCIIEQKDSQKLEFVKDCENENTLNISKCVGTVPMYKNIVSSIWTKKGDHIISEAIESLGSWEISYVEKVMKAMDYYPNAVFIDAGSNIEAYTIPVATMNRRVVAVDMMNDIFDIIKKSLQKKNLKRYVNLENNVLSDKKLETYYPVNNKNTNPGSIYAVKLVEEKKKSEDSMAMGPKFKSVKLIVT